MLMLDWITARRAQTLLVLGAFTIGVLFAAIALQLGDKAPKSSVEANRIGIVVSCEALNDVIHRSRSIRSKPAEILFEIVLGVAPTHKRWALQRALTEQRTHPELTGLPDVDCDKVVAKAKSDRRVPAPSGFILPP